MNVFMLRIFIGCLLLLVMIPATDGRAAESDDEKPGNGWRLSVGAGLIVAPTFTGAKHYSLLAVPDVRVVYKESFFANIRDGIGYAIVNQDGWRIGPTVGYTFRRSENAGDSVFRIAGSRDSSLQGMGDVAGTVLLGGFAEYSLKPYKLRLDLHKGVNGHKGVIVEGKVSYGGMLMFVGPPVIYSIGPHFSYGDRTYNNAYWGVSPEQSARSGLEAYRADAGFIAYGVNAFARMPMVTSVSVSLVASFDCLAASVTHSPLVRFRGSEYQAMGGLFVNHSF